MNKKIIKRRKIIFSENNEEMIFINDIDSEYIRVENFILCPDYNFKEFYWFDIEDGIIIKRLNMSEETFSDIKSAVDYILNEYDFTKDDFYVYEFFNDAILSYYEEYGLIEKKY